MKRPLFLVFLSLLFVTSNAQQHSRLVATVDSSGDGDSVHYTYSGNRGSILKMVPGLYPHSYSIDLYDSFNYYGNSLIPAPWNSGSKIYDSNDNVLVALTYRKVFQNPVTFLTIDSNQYDSNNNLTLRRYYANSQANPIPVLQKAEDNFYNAGLLTKSVVNDYGKVTVYNYGYNNNQLVFVAIYDGIGTKLLSTTSYAYNSNNQLVFEANGHYDTTGVLLDSLQTFNTYIGTKLAQELHQKFAGGVMTNTDKTEYNYYNQLITVNIYNWISGQWVAGPVDSNFFDSKNDKVLRLYTGYDVYGKVMTQFRTTMVYDADHNMRYEFTENYDTSAKIFVNNFLDSSVYDHLHQLVYYWQYEWDKDSSRWYGYESWFIHNYYEYFWPTKVEKASNANPELTIFPNPVQHMLQFRMGVKEKQHCTFTITDIQGRLLRQWTEEINVNEVIATPLIDLPNGTYVLGASYSGVRLSKRFVVAH